MPNVHVRLHDSAAKTFSNGYAMTASTRLIVPPLKASALHDLRYEELSHEARLRGGRSQLRLPPPHRSIAEVAAEPLIGMIRGKSFEFLRLSLWHLF